MKIQVDGKDLFEITEDEMEILRYVLPSATLEDDLKRRLEWVLKHKVAMTYKNIKKEWTTRLEADASIISLPTRDKAFFDMVKARSDYKDRDARDLQAAEAEGT